MLWNVWDEHDLRNRHVEGFELLCNDRDAFGEVDELAVVSDGVIRE